MAHNRPLTLIRPNVRDRSSPCENSNSCRARRNILEKLRIIRTDAAADIRLDAVLENCIFYISPMYEFSHSLGHERTSRDVRVTSVLPPTTDIHRGRSFAGLLRGYSLLLLMGFTVVHSGTLECAQGRIFDRS